MVDKKTIEIKIAEAFSSMEFCMGLMAATLFLISLWSGFVGGIVLSVVAIGFMLVMDAKIKEVWKNGLES